MLDSQTTTQSLAWDQISKSAYKSEKAMANLLRANSDYADYLLLPGGLEIEIPEITIPAIKSVPPWERM